MVVLCWLATRGIGGIAWGGVGVGWGRYGKGCEGYAAWVGSEGVGWGGVGWGGARVWG